MFFCSICNLFGGNSFSAVLRHMGEIHRYDPGLVILCGIGRCPQTYKNYESFRSHVYRKHREVLHSPPSSNDTGENASNFEAESTEEYNLDEFELNTNNELAVPDMKKYGAKFLLKTREEYRIPQLTLNKIVSDMKGLWMSSIESIREEVKKVVSSEETDGLMKSFDNSFPLRDLETEYLQLQYYKNNFNYLVSAIGKLDHYHVIMV